MSELERLARQALQALLSQLRPPPPQAGVTALLEWLPPPPRLAPTLNPQIDRALHSLAERQPDQRLRAAVYTLDGLVHMAVEMADQLVQSLWKFARFNLPRILGARAPSPQHSY